MKDKLFIYDLETTGLNPKKHGIHEIGAYIVINGITKEKFELKINPLSARKEVVTEALDASNTSYDDLRIRPSYINSFNQLKTKLEKYVNPYDSEDKFHLVGYNNSSFDDNFLRQFFKDNNHKFFGSYFYQNSIDVMRMASWKLRKERHSMGNFRLATVAKRLGINVDESKLHSSLYDTELTFKILKKVMPKWKTNQNV